MLTAVLATLWLCHPGSARDPCTANLTATRVNANVTTQIVRAQANTRSRFDCFYVYHTVSRANARTAPMEITSRERTSAVVQASRFSQICQVWAPVYRQATLRTMTALPFDAAAYDSAYTDVRRAWDDFVAHESHGRPFILIGHSQGSSMLIRLIRERIDGNRTLRARMVSAVLLGGNVTSKSFTHVHACATAGQIGCVIAYSSFITTPAADARYGIPGQGVSLQSRQTERTGITNICTNPAAFSTGVAALDSFFPTDTQRGNGVEATTPWIEYAHALQARCERRGTASWLLVTRASNPSGRLPRFTPLPTSFGTHLDDPYVGFGNLIDDVRAQERAYERAH